MGVARKQPGCVVVAIHDMIGSANFLHPPTTCGKRDVPAHLNEDRRCPVRPAQCICSAIARERVSYLDGLILRAQYPLMTQRHCTGVVGNYSSAGVD